MDKFMHTFDLPKLNQEDHNNLNRSITSNEIEAGIKKKSSQVKGSLDSDEFLTQPYPTFKELTPCFKLSHYSKRKGMTTNLFCEANLEKETTKKIIG